jgi:hypothetical protein
VPAFAHRDVDSVESNVGGGFGQFFSGEKLQMFGEDCDFQLVLRGLLVSGAKRQRPAEHHTSASQKHTPRYFFSYGSHPLNAYSPRPKFKAATVPRL